MAATADDIKKLIFSADGSPYAKISTVNADGLIYSADGSPYWGTLSTPAPPATTFKLYVGSTQVTTMYVGSTEVTQAYMGTTALKT